MNFQFPTAMYQFGVWANRMISRRDIEKRKTHFDENSSLSSQKTIMINDKAAKLNVSSWDILHFNGIDPSQSNYGSHEDLIQRSRKLQLN